MANVIVNELEQNNFEGKVFCKLIEQVDNPLLATKLECLYLRMQKSYQMKLLEELANE